MNFPSKLIEEAVIEISKLPGIGKKSALRLTLHLLKRDESQTQLLADALISMRTKTTFCRKCHNISDDIPLLGETQPRGQFLSQLAASIFQKLRERLLQHPSYCNLVRL